MAALEGEAQSSALHEDAGGFADNATAERIIERVDQAAGVAVPIDDRQRNRVALRDKRAVARGRQFAKRPLVVNEPRQSREVVGSNEPAYRGFLLMGVGEEGVPVAVSEARGLDVPVETRRPARSVRGSAERFEFAQHHERDQTRPVGRTLPDVEPSPSQRDRLDELAHIAPVGEVLFRLHSAGRLKRRRHVGRDRPSVEGVRTALGDGAQRRGEPNLDEPVAFARRSAAGQEEPVSGPAQPVFLHRPVPRHARVHRKAFLGAADSGLEQFVEALGPMGVQQQLPTGDGARNSDRVRRDIVGRNAQGRDRLERGCRG